MRARLTIDLKSLQQNFKTMCGKTTAHVAAVVKADGYGIGAGNVISALDAHNPHGYFTTTLEAALPLHGLTNKPIYLLHGLIAADIADIKQHGFIPVLNTLESLQLWAESNRQSGVIAPSWLHYDTAMNRLGFTDAELESLLAEPHLLAQSGLAGFMTHFACSDIPNHPYNVEQPKRFWNMHARIVKAASRSIEASLSNSGSIWHGYGAGETVARCGAGLYGIECAGVSPSGLMPVIALEAPILQIRNIQAGETVGYEGLYTADKSTRLATVNFGYADGVLRAGRGKIKAYLGGHLCHEVGRVSMDLLTFDVTAVPEEILAKNLMLELVGANQSIDDLARQCGGTSGYELMVNLSRRAERIFRHN